MYFHPAIDFDINQKHQKQNNRTSSDLIEKNSE